MTAKQLDRLLNEQCVRCGAHAPNTNLCDTHNAEANERTRRSLRKKRQQHRARGCCAFCGRRSKRYRCRRCARVSTVDAQARIGESSD